MGESEKQALETEKEKEYNQTKVHVKSPIVKYIGMVVLLFLIALAFIIAYFVYDDNLKHRMETVTEVRNGKRTSQEIIT